MSTNDILLELQAWREKAEALEKENERLRDDIISEIERLEKMDIDPERDYLTRIFALRWVLDKMDTPQQPKEATVSKLREKIETFVNESNTDIDELDLNSIITIAEEYFQKELHEYKQIANDATEDNGRVYDEIEALEKESKRSLIYAKQIAEYLHEKTKEPTWEVVSTLSGVLSQIDSMLVGFEPDKPEESEKSCITCLNAKITLTTNGCNTNQIMANMKKDCVRWIKKTGRRQ